MHEPCGRDAPLYVQLTHDNNNPHQQGDKKPPCFYLKVQTKQGLAKKMNATGRRHSEEAWHAQAITSPPGTHITGVSKLNRIRKERDSLTHGTTSIKTSRVMG